MNITTDQIQWAREQQNALDALDDREYIKAICNLMVKMLDNPATSNLDFSQARALCKDFAEAVEVQLEGQASNITEPEAPTEEFDDANFGFESFVKEDRKPTLDEAKAYLAKKGYVLKG